METTKSLSKDQTSAISMLPHKGALRDHTALYRKTSLPVSPGLRGKGKICWVQVASESPDAIKKVKDVVEAQKTMQKQSLPLSKGNTPSLSVPVCTLSI